MKRFKVIGFLMLVVLSFVTCKNKESDKKSQALTKKEILNESKQDFNKRMQWWRNAKFGMFIHWGSYAIPAGVYKGKRIKGNAEWIMSKAPIPVAKYEQYPRQFNPVKYDPDRWVKLAKNAGMKYIIITSKHHEGFSLWDSKVSKYDAVDFAAVHKDLLAPLKKACDKYGIKLGFYYSIMDWHHPDAQAPKYPNYNTKKKTNPHFDRYVQQYLKPQLKELVRNYDPAVLWFDGEWIPEWTHDYAVDIYTMLRKMKPNIIINNRVDVGRNGMKGMNEADTTQYVGDFGTPEQQILEDTTDFDWESCMTMNNTWGFKASDHNWKSAKQLISNLADIAAKGGNYLLNVGPTAEGLIPEASVERLHKMGDWMDNNGEAIYRTERLQHHYKQGDGIRYTKKKGKPIYYGIVLDKPGATISFKYLKPDEGSQVRLLGYDGSVDWSFDKEKGLIVHIPGDVKSDQSFENGLVFKIKGEEVG